MSLWRKFQIDNAENMLCVNVACHSNGVFFFFFVFFYLASFWQPWYCAMCLKKKKNSYFLLIVTSWCIHVFAEFEKTTFSFIMLLFGDFCFCEGNMYIVQIKKCSNVMTNKSERKDGLSQKQKKKKLFFFFYSLWFLYNVRLCSRIHIRQNPPQPERTGWVIEMLELSLKQKKANTGIESWSVGVGFAREGKRQLWNVELQRSHRCVEEENGFLWAVTITVIEHKCRAALHRLNNTGAGPTGVLQFAFVSLW